jgi:hypothetical protein
MAPDREWISTLSVVAQPRSVYPLITQRPDAASTGKFAEIPHRHRASLPWGVGRGCFEGWEWVSAARRGSVCSLGLEASPGGHCKGKAFLHGRYSRRSGWRPSDSPSGFYRGNERKEGRLHPGETFHYELVNPYDMSAPRFRPADPNAPVPLPGPTDVKPRFAGVPNLPLDPPRIGNADPRPRPVATPDAAPNPPQ